MGFSKIGYLNFTSHSHTHTQHLADDKQSVRFVFFLFLLHSVCTQSRLKKKFIIPSLTRIYSVQLPIKYKSNVHRLISLSNAERKNWKIVIRPSEYLKVLQCFFPSFLFISFHRATHRHWKRTSDRERRKISGQRWTLSERREEKKKTADLLLLLVRTRVH